MRVNLNQNSLSLFPSWTLSSIFPHEFVTQICWCQSQGYPAEADRKEVDVLEGECMDVWMEGA